MKKTIPLALVVCLALSVSNVALAASRATKPREQTSLARVVSCLEAKLRVLIPGVQSELSPPLPSPSSELEPPWPRRASEISPPLPH